MTLRTHITSSLVAVALWSGSAQAEELTHPPVTLTAAINRSTQARTGTPDQRIFLYRRNGFAIQQRVWSTAGDVVGSWSPWANFTQNDVASQRFYGTSMAAWAGEFFDSAFAMFLPRFGVGLNYTDGLDRNKIGQPFTNWLPSARFWFHLMPPANASGNDFQPFTSFTWRNGNDLRVNMWGLSPTFSASGLTQTGQSLREMAFMSGAWGFTDHGTPPGNFFVRVGPQGSLWMNPNGDGRGWVFVTAEDGHMWSRTWNRPGWSWENHGRPISTSELGTPVAMTYDGKVQVFVSGRTATGWRLFGRHFNGATWNAWQDFGTPPGLVSGGVPSDSGFDMTGAAVWRTSTNVLRINVFGTSDWVDDASSGLPTHLGGRLVEMTWNGGSWGWGTPTQLGQTMFMNLGQGVAGNFPVRVQVTDVEVIDDPGWERISVFVEDELGRDWEYVWTGTWTWNQL